ncbi:MAG: alpha-2-macroglobulin family protein [Aliishimia sp.]
MVLRVIAKIYAVIFLVLSTVSAQGQPLTSNAVPQDRFIYSPDADFPGGDISNLFDTTQQACARACLSMSDCNAFTFNARSNACFPKTGATTSEIYVGAMSALRVATDPQVLAQESVRRAALPFLTEDDVKRANTLVADIATRFPAGNQTAQSLTVSLAQALSQKSYVNARNWAGTLASLTDSPDAWSSYSYASLRVPNSVSRGERNRARRDAVPAALNAVLRAKGDAAHAAALGQLADALEANGRGRDSIPALRRATQLSPRDDFAAKLDKVINTFGFRIIEHQVDNNSAAPRICATFSEPLVKSGVDYDTFVRVPNLTVVTETSGAQLCVTGVEHGAQYDVTFRSGLPSARGENMQRDVALQLYVRDRNPSVSFPGRGYVLPRLEGAALPVQTVNASQLDLQLRQVSDRNLLRAIQDNYFGRPLSGFAEDAFANDVAAEVWSGEAEVQTELNRETTTRLPLGDMLTGMKPGIYVLTARVKGVDRYDEAGATQWFVVSDLGLSSMKGSDGLHVGVQSLSDAQARAGVNVSLVSKANAVLARATTDADGFARFEAGFARGTGSAAPALILAETSDDMAFLPLTGPAFDLSDRGVEGRAAPGALDVFLATDRGAYRAGETIGVTALIRDATGAQAEPNLPLIAVLQRPDGAEYSRTIATKAAAGGHVFELPIGADVPRGTWRLDMRLGDGDTALSSTTVLVEDFLPERLDFTLELQGDALRLSDRPPLTVSARYLFGAPAGDIPVEADIRLRPTRAQDGWPGYVFGRHDSTLRRQTSSLQPVRTDSDGRATLGLEFPVIPTPDVPLDVEIVARVSEGSGRPVERRLVKPIRLTTPIIGFKPSFEDVAAEDSDAVFDMVALDPTGAAMRGELIWVLNRVETRYQWYQLYGNWNWEPITRRTRIANGTMELTGQAASLSVPVRWGSYELVAELAGTQVSASTVFSAGWYGSGDSTQTPDRLNVGLDKPTYSVGETAQFRITAPQGGTAMVSVLASDVIHREVVTLDPGESVVPLRVTQAWGSGAYVTASVLRPLGGDDPNPTRAMGLAHAKVAPGDKALDVVILAPISTDGQPGNTDVQVRVKGLPTGTQAHVTLAAVDLGILNLTGHDSPDPKGHYFGQRRLGVELRDIYGRLIDGQSGALGRVRSGGDAGAQMRLQTPPPAEANMVFFSGLVQTDAQGMALITVPKPAFNGTIRLDVIAWTDTAVGEATAEIIARDPVVVTASLPRFLAPGDESRLLLEFVHADGAGGDMPLTIDAPELFLGVAPDTVSIKAGQKTTLSLPIVAADVGDISLKVTLDLPNGTHLDKTLNLGVRRNDPETAFTRRFELADGATFRFDQEVFAGLLPGTGGAVVSAGPLARFDVPGLMNQLDRNSYGCTEQLTSGAMPLLYLSEFSADTDVQSRIQNAVARILTRQTSGGSFGLWRADSGEFWLDAYVTDFLTRARDAGHDVPSLAIKLALNNLRNRVNYAPDFDKGGEDIAYALLVLAQEGAASIADLRYYADAKREAFATPLSAAQIGAALASYGDTLRADSMFAQAARLLKRGSDTRVWRDDFGSSVSDKAGVLRLAAVSGSQAIDRANLAQSLIPQRSLSTQEAAQVLMAANALRGTPGSSGLLVNGVAAAGPVVKRLKNTDDGTVFEIRNTSGTSTDVTLTTYGVPDIAPDAGGYGYALKRRYFTPDGIEVSGPFTTGDQMVVVLTITPFEEVGARLMVEDALPAGLEIDNPNLIQSGQIRGLDWLTSTQVENSEFLSDRFRAALDVQDAKEVHLAYKVRAVTPGTYHHPAALVHDMYRPEYRAITETGRLVINQ